MSYGYLATWEDSDVVIEVQQPRRDASHRLMAYIVARLGDTIIHPAEINLCNQRDRVDFHALALQKDGRVHWESYLAVLIAPLQAALEQQASTEDEAPTVLRKPLVVCMGDVDPEPVEWLWEPYIPRRKLTLLEGDPGVGKTWLALAIAAGVSQGRTPWQGEAMTPGAVLYMTAWGIRSARVWMPPGRMSAACTCS
jgi:hypothetical protein